MLRIPSFSSKEKMVAEFVENFCNNNNLYYEKDYKGNIYVTKGKADYYPCVVAHMDTVHKDQVELVDNKTLLNILEFVEESSGSNLTILSAAHPVSGQPTGIGGDDKCGVYICLELLNRMNNIKAAFFVEEECGMLGSKNLHAKFFKDVGYALQFDAPTKNWFSYSCSGVRLWSEEFFNIISPILNEHSVDNISMDPFTDVVQIRKHFDFCCAVLPTGYYEQHSVNEFVVEEHTMECVKIGEKFIELLGEKRYIFKDDNSKFDFEDKPIYENVEKFIYDELDNDKMYFSEDFSEEDIKDLREYVLGDFEDMEKDNFDDYFG